MEPYIVAEKTLWFPLQEYYSAVLTDISLEEVEDVQVELESFLQVRAHPRVRLID